MPLNPVGPLVLDTSVVLNLLASGVSEGVLAGLGCLCYICAAVADETLFIRSPEPGQPHEQVSVDPWVLSKSSRRISPESEAEEELYVRFAVDLDDGEAMSLALCCSRSYALATDDRKARRIASTRKTGPVRLVSTAGVMRHWAAVALPPDPDLKSALRDIERLARFIPPLDDPSHAWWIQSRGL